VLRKSVPTRNKRDRTIGINNNKFGEINIKVIQKHSIYPEAVGPGVRVVKLVRHIFRSSLDASRFVGEQRRQDNIKLFATILSYYHSYIDIVITNIYRACVFIIIVVGSLLFIIDC